MFSTLQTVCTGGGKLSSKLASAATANICKDILNCYGASEIGLMAAGHVSLLERNPDALGYAVPHVEIQVVDDDDRPLPAGEEGRVRVTGRTLIKGYVDAPGTPPNPAFKDGWFYTGDNGILEDDGLLCIYGRSGEVVNAGGVKLAFDALELALRGYAGVADAGVATLADSMDVEKIYCAVVPGASFDLGGFEAHIKSNDELRELLKKAAGICRVDAIPRGENGKIQRAMLSEKIKSRSWTWPNGSFLFQV
jgi:acyl-coenzyme A synthetase/AMP-(fatty) acid ligase